MTWIIITKKYRPRCTVMTTKSKAHLHGMDIIITGRRGRAVHCLARPWVNVLHFYIVHLLPVTRQRLVVRQVSYCFIQVILGPSKGPPYFGLWEPHTEQGVYVLLLHLHLWTTELPVSLTLLHFISRIPEDVVTS